MQRRASHQPSIRLETRLVAAAALALLLSACGGEIHGAQDPALGKRPGAPSGPLAGAYAPVELENLITGEVWQTTHINPAEFETLEPAPWWKKNAPREPSLPGLRSLLVRSPDATSDGDFHLRELYGHDFMHVATIDSFPGRLDENNALSMLLVEKYHRIAFRAGQRLRVLIAPNGSTWIHASHEIGRPEHTTDLPEGWSYREAPVERDVEIELTGTVQRIDDSQGDSYEGPVDLDVLGIRLAPLLATSRPEDDS